MRTPPVATPIVHTGKQQGHALLEDEGREGGGSFKDVHLWLWGVRQQARVGPLGIWRTGCVVCVGLGSVADI